jgi:MOSC domain-containing protein
VAVIVELNYYPVKGYSGTSVRDAVLTPAGLTHNRSFMVIGADGVFCSQRHSPRLALIPPELTAGGERLTLRGLPGCLNASRPTWSGLPHQGIHQVVNSQVK